MAIFTHIGPRGGRYRVENGRKVYDAPYERDKITAVSAEADNAPGFWGVVWLLICAPFRFLGFCGEHGGGIGWLAAICLISSLLGLALQGLNRLFWHFAGLLQAAHLIG